MELIPVIPPFLAILNTTAASLVSLGYFFVRRKNTSAHRACMVSALLVSTVFMVFYLYYHAKVGNIPFAGVGSIRPVYFSLLATHVILAAVLFPLVLVTAWLAISGNTTRHRRLARWTLPIWLYVSVTGVIIYLMAFHIYAA
jgi:putative membrane protein